MQSDSLPMLPVDSALSGKVYPDVNYYSHLYRIYLCAQEYEEPQAVDGSRLTWSEIFSVYSLACICDYLWMSQGGLQQKQSLSKRLNNDKVVIQKEPKALYEIIDDEAARYLCETRSEAIEAYGYALTCRERELAEERRKSHRTKIGKAVSKRKLDQYLPVKLALFEAYNAGGPWKNNRSAATSIYGAMDESLKNKIASTDAIKQCSVWIGQYRKGVIKNIPDLPECIYPK